MRMHGPSCKIKKLIIIIIIIIITMSLAIGFLPGISLEPAVTIIIIIIFIIGKDTISFMHSIYTSNPETNHVPKEYNVAAIPSLLFMAPISLAPALALMYFTSALSKVCVHCPIWQFSVVP
jgi:hypothetical protein